MPTHRHRHVQSPGGGGAAAVILECDEIEAVEPATVPLRMVCEARRVAEREAPCSGAFTCSSRANGITPSCTHSCVSHAWSLSLTRMVTRAALPLSKPWMAPMPHVGAAIAGHVIAQPAANAAESA